MTDHSQPPVTIRTTATESQIMTYARWKQRRTAVYAAAVLLTTVAIPAAEAAAPTGTGTAGSVGKAQKQTSITPEQHASDPRRYGPVVLTQSFPMDPDNRQFKEALRDLRRRETDTDSDTDPQRPGMNVLHDGPALDLTDPRFDRGYDEPGPVRKIDLHVPASPAESMVETQTEAKAKTETTHDPKVNATATAGLAETAAKTEAKVEASTEAKTDATTAAKTEAASKTGAGSSMRAKSEAELHAELHSEAKAETQLRAKEALAAERAKAAARELAETQAEVEALMSAEERSAARLEEERRAKAKEMQARADAAKAEQARVEKEDLRGVRHLLRMGMGVPQSLASMLDDAAPGQGQDELEEVTYGRQSGRVTANEVDRKILALRDNHRDLYENLVDALKRAVPNVPGAWVSLLVPIVWDNVDGFE